MIKFDSSFNKIENFKLNDFNLKKIIGNKGKYIPCKNTCDLKFKYIDENIDDLKISQDNDKNVIKIESNSYFNTDNFIINFNLEDYYLKYILISKTYHFYNDINTDNNSNQPGEFIEIFFFHETKNEEKKLAMSLIVSNRAGIGKNDVNGSELTAFFQSIKTNLNFKTEISGMNYSILNLFRTTTNGAFGNSFYTYKNGKFIYDFNDKNYICEKKINTVILFKDIFYCDSKDDLLKDLFPNNNIYNNSNSKNKVNNISINLTGSLDLNGKNLKKDYDLIDCQEYTGLEDSITENDNIVVNKNKLTKKQDSVVNYIITNISKYKWYIITFILIIIQVILYYKFLKYIYLKYNPFEN